MTAIRKFRRAADCACMLLTATYAQAQEATVDEATVDEATVDEATVDEATVDEATVDEAEDNRAELQELRARTDKMEEDVAALREELRAERARERGSAEEKEKEKEKAAPLPKNLSEQSTSVTPHETMRDDHHASPRPGNASLDPAYKGFFPLFGGKTWVKFGGYAKVDAMLDSTRMGNPNKFATASIPVEGEAEFDSPEQFNLHAKQSRLNFEVRSPTPVGSVRFVYENDFYGSGTSPGMAYNLRHLYIQFANLTVGQTWTTFLDSDTLPDTLDFAGPGVQAILRQPQARYSYSPVKEKLHLSLAAEEPSSDLTLPVGAEARRLAPDVAGNVRLEGALGHVQIGGVGRVLAYDNGGADGGDSTFAFGVSASAKLNVGRRDTLMGAVVYGDGVGRYAQDLGTSLAGYVDADGDIRTLQAIGFFSGYRHFWIKNLSSQVTYGYLELEGSDDLGPASYRRTHYGQGNLVWSPFDAMSLGGELLYGHKATQDESEGDAFRGMMSIKYKIN